MVQFFQAYVVIVSDTHWNMHTQSYPWKRDGWRVHTITYYLIVFYTIYGSEEAQFVKV